MRSGHPATSYCTGIDCAGECARELGQLREKMNQCDGCRRGLPLRDGVHSNPDGSYDHIGCTKHLYA